MSHNLLQIFHFIFSAILTFILLKFTIPIFKKIMPAFPTKRGMHNIVKPTSGGILFTTIYFILAIYQGYVLALLSMPMAILGLLDDKYNISKLVRFLMQFLNLTIISIYLKTHNIGIFQSGYDYNFIYYLFLIFCGTAIVNFINFMDGIDGLLCGSMIVIFATINLQFHFLSPVIGALTAFIYFNWYPSKMFMGDSGSLYLGTFLVSLIYSSPTYINLIKILLLCSPLLIDSFVCIVRRIINKQNIFNSHKLHLYQRLVSNGMSHSKVSLFYISSITILGLVYTFAEIKYLLFTVLFIILLGFLLDKKYALDFNY